MAGRRSGFTRRALTAGALSAGLLGVAACSPLSTQIPYAPSDGVRAILGEEVTIENLLILTEGEGEPALIVAGVTNRTGETVTIELTFGEDLTTSLRVAGNDTVLLPAPEGSDDESLILDASPAAPGATTSVTIATSGAGSVTIQAPVLDGTLAPYDEYIESYLGDYEPTN